MNTSNTNPMPILFVGHGSPMNAIEESEFSRAWVDAAKNIPKPRAILCISAHWETRGTLLTAMDMPATIHDFYSFPKALFEVRYPAPGSIELVEEIVGTVKNASILPDLRWGLDHGCWSVLVRMYPNADVPVVQLSLDATQPPRYHYELAKELSWLRNQGVLILSSGNMVHNLRMMQVKDPNNFNAEFGFDWALEANALFKKFITEHNHEKLCDYPSLGKAAQLAVPTPEHYLPMLYILALQKENEALTFFNDKAVAGSLTMTSFKIGS